MYDDDHAAGKAPTRAENDAKWEAYVRGFAEQYIERGWLLHPLEPGDKRPPIVRGRDGTPVWSKNPRTGEPERDAGGNPVPARYKWEKYRERPTTMADVDEWLKRYGDINLGLITGRTPSPPASWVFALDLDGEAGRDALFSARPEMQQTARRTLMQLTPHGWHCLFRMPPDKDLKNTAGILPGVDTRATGGYIVIAPSVLETGPYKWAINDGAPLPDPLPVPEWLAAHQRPRGASGGDGADYRRDGRLDVAAILAGVPEGQRDQRLWELACKCRGADLPVAVAADVVARAAAGCTPPFAADLAREKVERAYGRYAPGTPPARQGGSGYRARPATVTVFSEFLARRRGRGAP